MSRITFTAPQAPLPSSFFFLSFFSFFLMTWPLKVQVSIISIKFLLTLNELLTRQARSRRTSEGVVNFDARVVGQGIPAGSSDPSNICRGRQAN